MNKADIYFPNFPKLNKKVKNVLTTRCEFTQERIEKMTSRGTVSISGPKIPTIITLVIPIEDYTDNKKLLDYGYWNVWNIDLEETYTDCVIIKRYSPSFQCGIMCIRLECQPSNIVSS